MSVEEPKPEVRKLQLEDTNFRVNSDGWVKKTIPEGQEYLEASTGDIWELINCKDPNLNGEQLFTWDAAMRETAKAGKRMPSNKEWDILLETKGDVPNLVFAGRRYTDGLFFNLSSDGNFWSSANSGSSAWGRGLISGFPNVYRDPYYKTNGFSVRCLKD